MRNGSRRKRDLEAVQEEKPTQDELHDAARRALDAGSELSHDSLFVGAQRLAGRGGDLTDVAGIRREANAYLRQQRDRCKAHRRRSHDAAAKEDE